ncbi:type I secretion protein ATPase [uncultured Tateyamaria sp.]|uniref:type I secretion protein ATPase n=1 Tax=uncultured Tateyamaria sp. TaxID=455651 RepID=UPI00263288DD|nr:type I secretion protein ATPase [uncultured Tateyamaria sp.]
MLMDKATEFISHFIGVFHIAVEEERLRDVYEKFKALQLLDPEHGQLLNINVNVHVPYTLKDFTATLDYPTFDVVQNHALPQASQAPLPMYLPAGPSSHLAAPPAALPVLPSMSFEANGMFALQLEPASSVVTITYQSAWLSDNDLISFSGTHTFVSPDTYIEKLETLADLASLIDGVDIGELPSLEDGAQDYAMDLYAMIDEVEAVPLTGLNVTILHGPEAVGQHENGENVVELSIMTELMPAYMQPDEPEEPQPEDAGQLSVGPDLDIFDVDPGHAVVAGANLLANEVVINTSWLDAPVLAVMGDVINIDAISQTNVLVTHQHTMGPAHAAPSNVVNMASMEYLSSQPETEDATEETAGDASLPSNWVVARVEADIVAVNWVQQFTFATDFDRAEIQFSGTETFIGLGENTIINAASFGELGYGYDLVIVGGSMISVTLINQLNVLLDEDDVTYDGPFAPDISGGDNLLANSASLTSIGLDSYTEMQASFAEAGQSLADGAGNITADVAQHSYFEGTEVLRVLYIEGDLTTLNLIEQTNILGDSDQVHLKLDEFEAQTGTQATVTGGSNALINSASVTEYGTDSTVLVGGEVYSDALLYQAELIDTDANPLGVGLNDLTDEAVVFLADGMIESDQPDPLVSAPILQDGSTSPDVMQTMLA